MKITRETYYDKNGRRIAKDRLDSDLSNVCSMGRDYKMSLDEAGEFFKVFDKEPQPKPRKKRIGVNMKALADHISESFRPLTIEDISTYMQCGPKYALDTAERLCELGLAKHYGSNKFIKAES